MAKRKIYVCDFETANNPELNNNYTFVWLAVAVEQRTKKPACIAYNIEDFIKWLLSTPNAVFYFHNLAFDGNFIISYILKRGWVFLTPGNKGKDKSFTCVANDFGQVFYIRLFKKVKNKVVSFTIYDSLKIIGLSENALGEKWGLTHKKGEIDYRLPRKEGYVATKEEVEYCINDCVMICEALQFFLDSDMLKGFTIGMISFKAFQETCPRWRDIFPVLPTETDTFLRKSYRGGITYVNPRFANKDIGAGVVYDANSLYPSQMLLKPMPCGYPEYFFGKPKIDYSKGRDLFIVRLLASFKVKKGHIPMIQFRHSLSFSPSDFIEVCEEPEELYLTNIDLDLFFESYDVMDIQFVEGYYFRSIDNVFKDFITKYGKLKEESSGGLRQVYKLILNNLYGKFGTNPRRLSRKPVLKDDGRVLFEDNGIEEINPIYVPVASFITSYGRAELCKVAAANWKRFLYCDTDSVHLVGNEPPIDCPVDDKKLGFWKRESTFTRARFLRAKTYIEEASNGVLGIKCAGMPKEAKDKVDWDNFHEGKSFTGKLARTTVDGGVILRETTFTIK